MHCVVAKCTDLPEEPAASIFRVTKLVKVDCEVIQWKKLVSCVGRVGGVWPVTAVAGGKR
jgi:hypothetical protein